MIAIRIRILQILLIPMAIVFGTNSIHAVPILDQSFDPSGGVNNMASDISRGVDKAQTFTVGISGSLVQVDLDINKWSPYAYLRGNLLLDIRTTLGGIPNENDSITLASLALPENFITATRGFYSIDISSFDVSVTEGDVLAIVLKSSILYS